MTPPFTPGSEVAGEIVALGDGVTGWSVGDRVTATTGVGGFAEQVAIDARSLRAVPDSMTFGQAATFVQSYETMLFAFTRRTTVREGETVLVLGAGGGIGLAAVDLARARSPRPIAAASTREKLAGAEAQGAVASIAYEDEDLKTRARELSGRRRRPRRRHRRRRARRARAAGVALRWSLSRDRVRVGHDPDAAAQPGAAEQPDRRRRRLGRLGDEEPGPSTRRSKPSCSRSPLMVSCDRSSPARSRSQTPAACAHRHRRTPHRRQGRAGSVAGVARGGMRDPQCGRVGRLNPKGSASMEVKELGHLVLYVRNLERSAAFYRDVLGWRQILPGEGQPMSFPAAAFSSGRTHHELLLIEVGEDAQALPQGRHVGLYHFGLKVGDTDDELRDALAPASRRPASPSSARPITPSPTASTSSTPTATRSSSTSTSPASTG